jgi:hypothetical protein
MFRSETRKTDHMFAEEGGKRTLDSDAVVVNFLQDVSEVNVCRNVDKHQRSCGNDGVKQGNDSRLTLNLGHSLHTVVSGNNRVGLAVNPVPSLVLVPHICSQDTVADGLADVSSKHGLSS